jgi:hypothetical protein
MYGIEATTSSRFAAEFRESIDSPFLSAVINEILRRMVRNSSHRLFGHELSFVIGMTSMA